jgi:hypothetical protein
VKTVGKNALKNTVITWTNKVLIILLQHMIKLHSVLLTWRLSEQLQVKEKYLKAGIPIFGFCTYTVGLFILKGTHSLRTTFPQIRVCYFLGKVPWTESGSYKNIQLFDFSNYILWPYSTHLLQLTSLIRAHYVIFRRIVGRINISVI